MDDLLYGHPSVVDIHSTGAYFGRRALTFLSVVRLYLDSIERHCREITCVVESAAEAKRQKTEAYDRSYSYRVMEALRNYSQNHSFPVTGATYNASWDDLFVTMRFSSEYHFDVREMSDAKLKGQIVDEIRRSGGRFELKTGIREYFGEICSIHLGIREIVEPACRDARAALSRQCSRWATTFGDTHATGVVAARFTSGRLDGEAAKVAVSEQAYSYTQSLVTKTQHIANMARREARW